MNLKGMQDRGKFFLLGICFQRHLQSIISETYLPFFPLSILASSSCHGTKLWLNIWSILCLTTLSNHSLHLDYSGYLAAFSFDSLSLGFHLYITIITSWLMLLSVFHTTECCSVTMVFIYSFVYYLLSTYTPGQTWSLSFQDLKFYWGRPAIK